MTLILTPLVGAEAGFSIDLTGILPDRLTGLSPAEISRLGILADERSLPLGDCFRVEGDASDGRLELRGDCSRVHWLGAGLRAGEVLVRGSAGRHVGEGMAGGRIVVEGDVGDFLAAEMTGGIVRVAGGAGDCAAGALAGSPSGMQGGVVVVAGGSGDFTASRLRRGIVAIGGDCGAGGGLEMLAGTLVVAGRLGPEAGLGMRRGSIVALGPAPSLGCGFRRGADWCPTVLPLLARRLLREAFSPAQPMLALRRYRQWHGDLLAGGGGEVFVADG
jgi:formylmethanofuran dehydrogenase subunit C